MRSEILKEISSLEETKNIKIHLAVESGSRAWGCPSTDSDYDVRIIYSRPMEDYLRIDAFPDNMDYFIGKELDINGWDISKTLKLVRKSNVTPFEWAQSPVVYKERSDFSKQILGLCKLYFSPRHAINHYRGIAKNTYFEIKDTETMKLKKLFYVLRPLMAAKWIIQKNEVPPMDISSLRPVLENDVIEKEMDDLLSFKTTVDESYLHSLSDSMSSYIENTFELVNSSDVQEREDLPGVDNLNEAFRKIIQLD